MIARVLAAAAAGLSALLMLPVVVLAGALDLAQPAPSTTAIEDIPPSYLAVYMDAVLTRCATLPWSVLAAIGRVESNHGRNGGAQMHPDGRVEPRIIGPALDGSAGVLLVRDSDGGHLDNDTVHDHAVGPMQFLPTTWAVAGLDASGDAVADPHNAIDAIHAAAAYLCTHGAGDLARIPDAVLAYNRSPDYVREVLDTASRYAVGPVAAVPASDTLIAMVLVNPRLEIYEAGRADIAAGRIDSRVLLTLHLASEHHTITVSSLQTGHSRCVGGSEHPGCSVSHHWYGRAVDISIVDGQRVTAANDAAREFALWLGQLPLALVPREIGTPWRELSSAPYFSDIAHADHLHAGWAR